MNASTRSSWSTLPREEFTSGGGSYINLGHFKQKDFSKLTYDEGMMKHCTSKDTILPMTTEQGLVQTRFHKGFQRRQQNNIINGFSHEEMQARETAAEMKKVRSQTMIANRCNMLETADKRNGYNIITGSVRNEALCPPLNKPGIRKFENHGLSSEALQRGKTILRESNIGRFFTPHESGPSHEYRQNVLYKEGLLSDKYCGVLELGKKDMKSYGVEDQFSKSQYMTTSAVAQNGLYESRLPGRFTPRKTPGNPSGNSDITNTWYKNADLNNKTMKCIV